MNLDLATETVCRVCIRDVPVAPGYFVLTDRSARMLPVAHVDWDREPCPGGTVEKWSTAPGDHTRERILDDDRCWSEEFKR